MAKHSVCATLKTEWKECVRCHIYVNKRDNKVHQQTCCDNFSVAEFEALPHGFIYNDIFFAKVDKMNVRRGKFSLPHNIHPVILLHPSTMKLLGLQQGSYVVVNCSNRQSSFRCWPSEAVSPSRVLLPDKQYFQPGCHVQLQSHVQCAELADLATEVCFSPKVQKEFLNSKGFKKHILEMLRESLIYHGMPLCLNYLGTFCQFEVTNIRSPALLKSDSNYEACSKNVKNDCVNHCKSNVLYTHKSTPFDASNNESILLDSSNDSENRFNFVDDHVPNIMCSTPLPMKDRVQRQKLFNQLSKSQSAFKVLQSSNAYFKVGPRTVISIEDVEIRNFTGVSMKKSFKDIGGLQHELRTLKNLLPTFLSSSDISSSVANLPRGILIHGIPGVGKSLTITALHHESSVPIVLVKCSEIYSKSPGGIVTCLKNSFRDAMEKAPCILIMEEIDVMYQCDKSSEKRLLVEELPKLFDSLLKQEGKNIVVIATANKPECVDSALRRHGRLEKEIQFNIPSSSERTEILEKLLEYRSHSLMHEQIVEISNEAHGFTGGDLEGLCNKAALNAKLRCSASKSDVSEDVITLEDVSRSLKSTRPSAMQDFVSEIPNVLWSDIGGMQELKEEVIDMIDLPLKHPEAFEASGISPSRGILIYGPPGCSKTMIAKAVATESNLNFISVKGPELFNKWVGESERAIRELFKKARLSAPCIIFFDEIDSLAAERSSTSSGSNVGERVLTQLLTEIDGIDIMAGVSIIAATNRPDLIDPVLLRPGRFDRVLYVPLPDKCTRKEIFQVKLRKMPIATDVDFEALTNATEGYTGAEITAVCKEAAMAVISQDAASTTSVVAMENFNEALQLIQPRTSKELISFYEDYKAKFCYHS